MTKKSSSKMSVDPDMDMHVKRLHYINESEAHGLSGDDNSLERLRQAQDESSSKTKSKSIGDAK